jgi:hypothetical protein
MMRGVNLLLLATFTMVLALAASVRAEGAASSGDLALARQLFADAAQLEARADWPAATLKLKRALAIKETPGLYYHLAYCEEQLGAFVAAARDYERASELIRAGSPAPDVEPLLPPAVRRVESRVAKLEVVVPPGVTAAAELDGQTLPPSAIGASVRLDPGQHRLVVRSPGRRDFQSDVILALGEHRTLKVFFGPDVAEKAPAVAAPAHPMSSAPPARDRSPAKPDERGGLGPREGVLLGEAALALAGLGTGIGFAVARGHAMERVEAAQRATPSGVGACDDSVTPVAPAAAQACAELQRAIDDYNRTTTIETVAFIGAGASAAALALTWVLWPSSSNELAMRIHPRKQGVLLVAGGSF